MTISRLITILFLSTLIFIIFFHPIYAITQDLGRHILLGEIIVQTHSVPKTNLLSYTYPNFAFINSHWLSEVIFFSVERAAGFFGLLLFSTLVAVSAFLLQLFYLKKQNIIPVIIVSLVYFRILLERTDLRPEIFSFFFLSIFIVVLYKFRAGFTRWIYILPLIQLLWVNMHIYFPIGIGVTGLFLIDHLITHRSKIIRKTFFTLVFILFSCTIATLINPNFIQGALFPFTVTQNYGFEIAENHDIFTIWNLSQQKSTILYFFFSVPLILIAFYINFKKTKPIDWLLAVSFTVIAAYSLRNLPLFVFATFIPLTKSFNILYTKFFSSIQNYKYLKIAFFLTTCLFIFWQIKYIVTFNKFGYQLPISASKAVDYLQKNNIAGPIFNNFDIGSYLVYRLYPKEKVFVDGRPEAYPAPFFQNYYIPIQKDKVLFQKANNKYHFNTIFISHTDPTPWTQQFLRDINANPQWKLVYLDPLVVIYIKNNTQNNRIKDFSILNAKSIAEANFNQDELAHLLTFYENIGWTDEIKAVDHKLLKLDPNSCFALRDIGTLLQNENNPEFEIYARKYQSVCN